MSNEKKEDPAQSDSGSGIGTLRAGVRALGVAAKGMGHALPGFVGQASKALGVVDEAMEHREAGVVENAVCGVAKVLGQGVVATPLVVAAGARAAAALPTPDPYSRMAAGFMGAMAATPGVNEAVRPVGEAIDRVCRSAFQPAKETQKKEAQQQLNQKNTQNHSINSFHPHIQASIPLAKYQSFNTPYNSSYNRPSFIYIPFNPRAEVQRILLSYPNLSFTDRMQIERRVESACSFMHCGFGYGIGGADFHSSLSMTNLLSSYNSYNIQSLVREALTSCGSIGGVAGDTAVIENLIDSEAHAEAEEYFLCFKMKEFSFAKSLLKQIEQEMYTCFFKYKTLPFFSLHFNNLGFTYPVIHPALQNTLIGEVIAFLDYWMKGFLNGGVFDAEFLKKWQIAKDCDETMLRQNLVDLKKYCKEKAQDLEYISLRELESRYDIELPKGTPAFKQPFMTSFRIIAYQEEIAMHGNILVPSSNFRVEYTIEPMPDYDAYVKKYYRENGCYPPEYEKLRLCYELYAEEIREKLPKMPFCRDYFQLLGMMNTYGYVYTTLEKMGKQPIIPENTEQKTYAVPNAFPPIPVRYFKTVNIDLIFGKIFKAMEENPQTKEALDAQLYTLFADRSIDALPDPYRQKLQEAIRTLLKTELTTQLPQGESFEINEKEEQLLVKKAERFIYMQVVQNHGSVTRNIPEMMELNVGDDLKMLTKLPLPKKLDVAQELLNKHMEIAKAIWDQKAVLTMADILQPFTKNLHEDMKAVFKEIDESCQKELDYILYYAKKGAGVLTLREINNPPAELSDDHKKLREDITLDFNKQLQEALGVLDLQIQEEEKELHVQLKELQKLLQMPQQIQQIINAITQDKNNQIAQVPANLRAINAANIAAFAASKDAEIAKFQTRLDACYKDLPGIQKDINTIQDALIGIPDAKDKASGQIKQDILKYMTDRFQENCINVKEKIYRKKAFEILKNVQSENAKNLAKFKEKIKHFHTLLGNNKAFCEHTLAEKYTYTNLTFTAKNLAEKTGDNYQIIGGCGLSLPKMKANRLHHAEPFSQALAKTLVAGQDEFVFNGEKYLVSNVSVADASKIKPIRGEAQNALINILENTDDKASVTEAIRKTPVDPSGALAMHYAAAVLDVETFKTLAHDAVQTTDFLGNTSLHFAAHAGNDAIITEILQKTPSMVECKNNRGLTPLFLAIQYGHLTSVQKLLSFKANPNQKLPNGLFPLYVALQKNHTDIALWMLENRSDMIINETIDSQMTALHLAIENGFEEVAMKLISMGANCDIKRKSDGFNAMHLAVKKGCITLLKAMADKGVSLETKLESQKNSLHLAAQYGQQACLDFLIEKKVDYHAKNQDGENPLMLAIKSGHADLAKKLAAISAIDSQNNQGQTASLLSLLYNIPAVGDLLIARGENPEMLDKSGFNHVYFLVRNGEESRFSALLSAGKINLKQEYELKRDEPDSRTKDDKKPDSTQKKGLNILELAARYGQFLIVYDLLDAGMVFKKHPDGLSLLEYAIQADESLYLREHIESKTNLAPFAALAARDGSLRCLSFLLPKCSDEQLAQAGIFQAGIESGNLELMEKILTRCKNINHAIDRQGNTILHLAVESGWSESFRLLIEHGANLQIRNKNNETAFHTAIKHKQATALKRLLKLTKPAEWPIDLWQLKQSDKAIQSILDMHQKRLPEIVEKTPSSEPEKKSVSLPSLMMNATLTNGLKRLERLFDEAGFDEACDLIEENPELINLFTASQGAGLLLRIFSNIHDYVKLLTEAKQKNIDLSFSADRLLALLCKKGINPALCTGKHNVLLSMMRAQTAAEAEYRLAIFTKYFPNSLKELALDSSGKKASILERTLHVENRESLFFAMETACKGDHNIYFLHEAIKANNYKQVKELLTRHPVDSLNEYKQTPLMLAAALNNIPMMDLLLFYGANPDKCDIYGKNALHHALESKAEEAAFNLVPLLRNKNKPDKQGRTPLMKAAGEGLLSVVRSLFLLTHDTESFDKYGHSALHYAALKGESSIIEYLVKQGYPVNQTEAFINPQKPHKNMKRTALHLAALKGQERAVHTLLELGADVLQQDTKERAFCEYAIRSKHPGMLELVLECMQRLKAYQSSERHPHLLKAAAMVDHVEMTALLILDDVNPNSVDKSGMTALHTAAIHDSGAMAELLVKGEDVVLNALDTFGYTPLHYAAELGHVGLIDVLCKAGAQVNNANSQQPAALFKACELGHLGAVSSLLKYQADFTKTNASGLTPGQIALLHGHRIVAEKLRTAGDKSLERAAIEKLPEVIARKILSEQHDFLAIKPEKPLKMGDFLIRQGLYRIKPQQEIMPSSSVTLDI